ncbi:MAG: DUF4276 family protein [Burkholderiales bacterium]|jgi:hypothetical protein
MRELVFLLEEDSAKAMLQSLLPRLLKADTFVRYITFQGKQDLEKQLVRKIRGYQSDKVRFIVLRDLDSHPDCSRLKQRLLNLCIESGRVHQCLVRLACKELESFYLADLLAVETALMIPGLAQKQQSKKFKQPDYLGSPVNELKTLTKNRYQKVAGSRVIGMHLNLDNQRSPSFRHLVTAIRRMENELIAEAG